MKLVIDIDELTYKAIVKPFRVLKGQRSCKSIITNACISIAMGKPLPKGHWIVGEKYYMGERNGCCSVCEDYFTNDWFEMNYCPNCGAKMVEQQESEE